MSVNSMVHSDTPALQVSMCVLIFYIIEFTHIYLRMALLGKSIILFLWRRIFFLDCLPYNLPKVVQPDISTHPLQKSTPISLLWQQEPLGMEFSLGVRASNGRSQTFSLSKHILSSIPHQHQLLLGKKQKRSSRLVIFFFAPNQNNVAKGLVSHRYRNMCTEALLCNAFWLLGRLSQGSFLPTLAMTLLDLYQVVG